jgi:DNA glycosylase AlkZ-like
MASVNLREIARLRLRNQRVVGGGGFASAPAAVGWLGAVQSQEYPFAKWTLGKRTPGLRDADVDALLAGGAILRTHILRPTWHFVLPADIRWMMALTGPRIAARMRPAFGTAVMDDPLIRRGMDAMAGALAGGNRLSRAQLARLIVAQGIVPTELDTVPMFMTAELQLLIVSGGLSGKVQTYALVDEVVPSGAQFDRDWSLAELTRRYFTSHGPATIADFVWWSGLTVGDTRRGLDANAANGAALDRFEVDGTAYFWAGDTSDPSVADDPSPTIHLMQGYDEYIVAYRSPRTPINVAGLANPSVLQRPPFTHAVIRDGQGVGFWRRRATKERLIIETSLLTDLNDGERRALAAAAERYARFVGLPVEVIP